MLLHIFARGGKSTQRKHQQVGVDLGEFFGKGIVCFFEKMSGEEDYRLREIQREYLDFLDDDVSASGVLLQFAEVKCPSGFKRYRAFSLPGQFAPRSELANRTLANSLPGTFAP